MAIKVTHLACVVAARMEALAFIATYTHAASA
jgi:hypothetical protein